MFTAQTNTRPLKRGTHRFHVGMSSAGYHTVWRQRDKKPGDYTYMFSFWAFDTLQKGTKPYAIKCDIDGINDGCNITAVYSENEQDDYAFYFYVYPEKVFGAQEILLTSKFNDTSNTILSFWAPKFGKRFGNIFINVKIYVQFKVYTSVFIIFLFLI